MGWVGYMDFVKGRGDSDTELCILKLGQCVICRSIHRHLTLTSLHIHVRLSGEPHNVVVKCLLR